MRLAIIATFFIVSLVAGQQEINSHISDYTLEETLLLLRIIYFYKKGDSVDSINKIDFSKPFEMSIK